MFLKKSQETPVLVDFCANWCGPCKSLGPILERLADEYAGAFILAKVDSDAEQMLVAGMGVRSLPTVVLFKNGQPADHFMGALPEGEIRAMLDKHVERAEASPLERAAELVELGQCDEAIALCQLIAADDPENCDVCLDMAQALLKKGDSESAVGAPTRQSISSSLKQTSTKCTSQQRKCESAAFCGSLTVQHFPSIPGKRDTKTHPF